ncbi:MAG: TniB family NTP-binding protein, partial [Sphingobium limneticum]
MKTNADINAAPIPASEPGTIPKAVRLPRKDRQPRRDPRDAGTTHDTAALAHSAASAEQMAVADCPDEPAKMLVTAKRLTEVAPPMEEPEAAEDGALTEGPTLSPDMRNAFLQFRQSNEGQRSPRVALAMNRLLRIRLPYPRQIAGMAELEELRLLGLKIRGEHQLGIVIFERTGCGKSTLAEQYKLMCEIDAPVGTKPVLHARLGSSGTVRDLWVAIIAALGDGFSAAGNETSLRARAMQLMDDAEVQLLILDETQHSGQKTGYSKDVIAELKILLDTGKVPIVLLGTEKANPLIKAEREFAGRLFAPCRLAPLDMDDDADWELWTDLLKQLDERLVSDDILSEPVGLNN